MAMFGLRLGVDPRACITTTPKPLKLLRELADRCRQRR
jgi:phage terminase large subunit-like protein